MSSGIESQVARGLEVVKRILETWREPQLASNVSHVYVDKFSLAEQMVNMAFASHVSVLEYVGLTFERLQLAKKWQGQEQRSVNLRFHSELECSFVRNQTKVTEGPEHVTTTKVNSVTVASSSSKVKTTITEYVWKVSPSYRLVMFPGTEAGNGVVLNEFSGSVEMITTSDRNPFSSHTINTPIDINISFLLENLSQEELKSRFQIDRTMNSCRTPRRNQPIEKTLSFFSDLTGWYRQVRQYFVSDFFGKQNMSTNKPQYRLADSYETFVPVLPIFDGSQNPAEVLLSVEDCAHLLTEQRRSIENELVEMAKVFPGPSEALVSILQGKICMVFDHGVRVNVAHFTSINFLETMLMDQLIQAIGKEVSALDFAEYMKFHRQKLFREEYLPRLFSYAIRQPGHFPEGVVSIEENVGGVNNPILTSVRQVSHPHTMFCPISESVTLSFKGERYIHSWMEQQFGSASDSVSYHLKARARAFSSFILMVGRISSPTGFSPTAAVILQNKDELDIPLLFERIPTPKEFRDAISSLSPEMQRFAKAYRAMQLESTLFAVCVIEIKPQLEKLLKLPSDSLTKHIKLTQDLLNCFIQYQIPSDLLSYDGDGNAPVDVKVQRVAHHVAAITGMIEQQKAEELAKAEEERRFREAERVRLEEERRRHQEEERRRHQEEEMQCLEAQVEYKCQPSPRKMAKGGMFSFFGGGSVSSKVSIDRSISPSVGSASRGHVVPPPSFDLPTFIPDISNAINLPTTEAIPEAAAPVSTPDAPTPITTPSESNLQQTQTEAPKGVLHEIVECEDYTKIPSELDQKFDELDEDAAVRAAIINLGPQWTFQSQTLLSTPSSRILNEPLQKEERNKAFDLLDALSRSGSLEIDAASLHIVLASSHSFEKSVIETVIQDNINPIVKVERSTLIASATIQKVPVLSLIREEHSERISTTLPRLCQAFL